MNMDKDVRLLTNRTSLKQLQLFEDGVYHWCQSAEQKGHREPGTAFGKDRHDPQQSYPHLHKKVHEMISGLPGMTRCMRVERHISFLR